MFEDRYNAWEFGTRTEVCENKLLKTSISPALSCDLSVLFERLHRGNNHIHAHNHIYVIFFYDSGTH